MVHILIFLVTSWLYSDCITPLSFRSKLSSGRSVCRYTTSMSFFACDLFLCIKCPQNLQCMAPWVGSHVKCSIRVTCGDCGIDQIDNQHAL